MNLDLLLILIFCSDSNESDFSSENMSDLQVTSEKNYSQSINQGDTENSNLVNVSELEVVRTRRALMFKVNNKRY